MEIAKIEYRAIIKFLTLEGSSPAEIHERLIKVYKEGSPSYATVKRWAAETKRGRKSLDDEPRSGRPVEVTTPEMCNAVKKLVEEDRRIRVRQIVEELGISTGTVETIIHEKMNLSKVCARWVPRMLTNSQMNARVTACKEIVAMISADQDDFYARLVTGDETWIHHFDPESKQESMQWLPVGSAPPKKFRTQPSSGKVMATVFWDAKGILLIDYMPPKVTITGEYFANIVQRLRAEIKEKRRGLLRKGVLLLIDNAPVHRAQIAQAAITECGFSQLNHPAYSPDLAPSDYFLFKHLKKHLRGKRFSSDNEVILTTEAYFEGCSESFYFTGIRDLENRLNKCINVMGNYVEK